MCRVFVSCFCVLSTVCFVIYCVFCMLYVVRPMSCVVRRMLCDVWWWKLWAVGVLPQSDEGQRRVPVWLLSPSGAELGVGVVSMVTATWQDVVFVLFPDARSSFTSTAVVAQLLSAVDGQCDGTQASITRT